MTATSCLAVFLAALSISPAGDNFRQMTLSATVPYTEKRPNNFVLSKQTPISIGHGILGNISKSTEPVDILSYGVHFRIPRNYIQTILDDKRDVAVDFVLVTHYPDFAGSNINFEGGRITDENRPWRWGCSPTFVRIVTANLPFSVKDDPNTTLFAEEAHEPDHPWKYGLLKSVKRSIYLADYYFQRPTKTNPGYMTSCVYKDLHTCDVSIRVSPELILLYEFNPDLLPHWQEIDQKVRNLIQSFIVK